MIFADSSGIFIFFSVSGVIKAGTTGNAVVFITWSVFLTILKNPFVPNLYANVPPEILSIITTTAKMRILVFNLFFGGLIVRVFSFSSLVFSFSASDILNLLDAVISNRVRHVHVSWLDERVVK